jgi:hypothetical protein
MGASMTEANGEEIPVRWVVLFTGTTLTADYEPTGSAGESPELVREVSHLCVQFHPHSEIRLFPRDREVYLYWRARSTGDHIVTRVSTAPNPDGMRTSLEYVSLVFDAETFARLGNNPFAVRTLKLPDMVREAFLSQQRDPLSLVIPAGVETDPATNPASLPPNNGLSTPENLKELEEYITAGSATLPPTFATWWESRGHVPENTFQIVLRAATPQAMTLHEATDLAADLASGTKAAIPNISSGDAVVTGLISSLLANSDGVIAQISAAADRVNSEGPDQFREHLADASRKATQMSSDLTALEKRLDDPAAATKLAELAAQYKGFGPEVLKIRHPNPFGGRKNTAPAQFAASAPALKLDNRSASNGSAESRRRSSEPTSRGTASAPRNNGALIGAGAAAAVVIVGLAAWQMAPKEKPTGKVASKPAAVATPAAKPTPAVAAKPSPPPITPDALLQQYARDILPIASLKAKSAATVNVTNNKKVPGEDDLRTITTKAIRDAYREALPPADFARTMGSGEDWTYSRYRKTLPTLLPAVRRAADSAAAVAFTEIQRSRAAVVRNTEPESTPQPEPTPRPRPRTTSEEEPRPKAVRRPDPTPTPRARPRATPRPRPATVVRPTPDTGTGSAASSGL